MKKILILLICMLQFAGLSAQYYLAPIDSTIAGFHLNDGDWVIALTIEQAGIGPRYDSLGNALDEDPNGTYIVSKINNHYTLRKYDLHYIGDKPDYKAGKLIDIVDNSTVSYNEDSILKVNREWIYPNVYMLDSLKVYDIQMNGDHSPFFRISFRTRHSTQIRTFSEVDVFTSPMLTRFLHKNLNYSYNTDTFIYRAFMNLLDLLKKNYHLQILE